MLQQFQALGREYPLSSASASIGTPTIHFPPNRRRNNRTSSQDLCQQNLSLAFTLRHPALTLRHLPTARRPAEGPPSAHSAALPCRPPPRRSRTSSRQQILSLAFTLFTLLRSYSPPGHLLSSPAPAGSITLLGYQRHWTWHLLPLLPLPAEGPPSAHSASLPCRPPPRRSRTSAPTAVNII